LTVTEVARELGVDVRNVLAWITSGELRAANVARSRDCKRPRWRITRDALDAFILSRTASAPPTRARRRSRLPAGVVEFYK
jgi:excisionase family DNA binding protein